MELCRLRFKNINSLAGEWGIDLTDEAYAQGIFTITGETGAGKTSILDAMCLALYGQTPRQKTRELKDKVITYGAADCYAEADFKADGKRYRVRWTQTKDKNGKPCAEHEISEVKDDGKLKPLKKDDGVKKTGVPAKVKDICKLDFDRFTKTVLLPQGEFARFLKSDGKERATLLKEITGLEIYGRISTQIYDTYKELEKAYSGDGGKLAKSKELENSLLTTEKRAEIEAFIGGYDEKNASLSALAEEARKAVEWHEKDAKIKGEEKALAERRDRLEKERSDAAQGSVKLARYDRGTTLKDLYGELLKSREETEKLKKDGEILSKNVEDGQKKADSAKAAHAENEKTLAAMKEKLEMLRPLLNRIIEIDARKTQLTGEEKEFAETLESTYKNLESCKREIDSLTRQSVRLADELSGLDKKLEEAKEAQRAAHEMLCRSDLGELAKGLADGEPCPLCGAVHHPKPYDGAGDERMEELRAEDEARAREVSELEKLSKKRRDEQGKCAAMLAAKQESERKDEETKNTTEQKLQSVRKTIAELIADKNGLSGGKDIVGENEKLKNDISRAENDAKKLSENEKAAASALDVALNSLENNSKLFSEKSEELAALEKRFSERLEQQGFEDESDLKDAFSLPPSEAERLRDIVDSIAREQREFEKDEHAVAEKRADMPPAPSSTLEKAKEDKVKAEEAKTDLIKELQAKKDALALDDARRQEAAAERIAVKKLEKRVKVYKRLNDLIGSAKGDRFDIIVQEMTLYRLVDAANEQLKRFTDRYCLVVSGGGTTEGNKDTSMTASLRIDVIDNDDCGAVRPTSNLSGGETFLVSLSLALALSHSLKGVSINSLFLDEGFGTLDEKSLDNVLSALSVMRRSGKMIGVISHVAGLPRKLGGCSILLSKSGNGHSTISGPGCTRIG